MEFLFLTKNVGDGIARGDVISILVEQQPEVQIASLRAQASGLICHALGHLLNLSPPPREFNWHAPSPSLPY